ncbi:unnamed protein product [Boreogadus saida]
MHCAFHGIFPPEIIPYDKKLKIACVTTTFILKGLISETCSTNPHHIPAFCLLLLALIFFSFHSLFNFIFFSFLSLLLLLFFHFFHSFFSFHFFHSLFCLIVNYFWAYFRLCFMSSLCHSLHKSPHFLSHILSALPAQTFSGLSRFILAILTSLLINKLIIFINHQTKNIKAQCVLIKRIQYTECPMVTPLML